MKRIPKIAIVHDYLVDKGGAERVVISISKAFPHAPIYTSIFDETKTFPYFKKIKNIYYSKRLYKLLSYIKDRERHASLILRYFRRLKLKKYDLIISSSSAFAIHTKHKQHICYCHTPARFIWHNQDYNLNKNPFTQLALNCISFLFKPFDLLAARNVFLFLTNSKNIQTRIKKSYNKKSVVLYPAVNTSKFSISKKKKKYFLIVSRLKLYKNIELAIKTFNDLDLPLYIVGSGPQENHLRSIAGDSINFLGNVPDTLLAELYANCRALIFPGEEDFGITPIEAQASGRPVIGYGKGGLRETIIDNVTGMFFREPTARSLTRTVIDFIEKEQTFNSKRIRAHAYEFNEQQFITNLKNLVKKSLL